MSHTPSTPPPCILFLDFDGVTHPEPCFQDNVFCRLHHIESVLREPGNTTLEIVISSSWRDHHSLDKLRKNFSHDMAVRVIGVTSSIKNPGQNWLPGHAPEFERQWEIEAWLQLNRPRGTTWVAIDDRDYWFAPGCPNLLLTDRKTGFTESDSIRLREMLGARR